jgi:cytochrome P450
MSASLTVRDAPGAWETLRIIRKTVRNPIDAWPAAVYTDGIVKSRFLGGTTYFVSDPALVQQVLVDDADLFVKAPPMRRALEPALGHGILTAEGARWRLQRRRSAPVFRPANVNSFLPAMLSAARDLRDRWSALPDDTELEIAHEMMGVTFDIILETMLSGRGDIDVGRCERSIRDFLESTSWAIILSALKAPMWTPFPGKGKAERGQTYLRTMTRARVDERRRTGERHEDLLSLMLDATDPDTGDAMSAEDITDNILTFIGAGHETTALALTWTFFLLSSHPEIEQRMLDEIASVTGGGELTPEKVAELVYVRQVVQESMRIYPPVAMVVRQAVAELDIGGARVLAGDNVFVPIYAIHRNAQLWPDPEVFDPERFSPEAVKARHRWAYLPFGAGPRICIGMGFALLEAAAILGVLLPRLQLRARAGFRPTPKLRVTMRPAEGMPMMLRGRGGD